MVFEDDPVFDAHWRRALPHVRAFLQREPDWHFLRLGGAFVQSYNERSASCPQAIQRIATLATHAYVVSRAFMEAWTRRAAFQGRGVDEDFMRYTTKNYALKAAMVWQSAKFNSLIAWGPPGSARDKYQRLIREAIDYETWQRSLNRGVQMLQHLPLLSFPLRAQLLKKSIGLELPADPRPALLI